MNTGRRNGQDPPARGSRRARFLLALTVATIAVAGSAAATHEARDTESHTTLEQVVVPTDPDAAAANEYTTLTTEAVAGAYLVRDPQSIAQLGRADRRRSLTYVSQFTDFQVADEESPARVEFLDPQAASAWRTQEAFHPFIVDAMIRQVNNYTAGSPVPQGDGTGAAMDFSLITGDQADSQQHNETVWIRELLEGNGPLDFGTGSEDTGFLTNPQTLSRAGCTALLAQHGGDASAVAAEAAGYTGVQDYDDYPGGPNTDFYDPDDVRDYWAAMGFPVWDGLMDHAQTHEFTPEGLAVPFYLTNGNHDALAQGNEDAIRAFEDIAIGCEKILATSADPSQDSLETIFANPTSRMLVPPDDGRRYVDKRQIKRIYGATDPNDDDHGFGFVDPAELAASNDSASYYSWDPPEAPGFRYVSIDTVSEGGILGPFGPSPPGSSQGNIDDPQWQWLEGELDQAKADGKLVVLFGHHPIRALRTWNVPDEAAQQCTADDDGLHETDGSSHDVNPGCDLDPRVSEPLHLGSPAEQANTPNTAETLTELLDRHPQVLTYVAGHTHENDIRPYERPDGTTWWELGTAAGADWPQQARLIEVMDNRDRTLSIFGTILDPALPATAPAECVTSDCAAAFGTADLAAIAHTLAFNDSQNTPAARSVAEGDPADQNAELLLRDPREADLQVRKSVSDGVVDSGESFDFDIEVRNLGPFGATGVTLTDELPGGLAVEQVTTTAGACTVNGTIECDLGDLEPGVRETVTITTSAAEAGEYRNEAEAAGILADPSPQNDSDGATVRVRETAAAAPKCRGAEATIVGTDGPDMLRGTSDRDVIVGGGGGDVIRGGGGRDLICGNGGDDVIRGGGGKDIIKGNRGEDVLRGGKGQDTLRGNKDADTVHGGRADDRTHGGAGDDEIKGHRGDDDLRGNAGDDDLRGNRGRDVCRGGIGRDTARGCEAEFRVP